jgi:hypothetical protein
LRVNIFLTFDYELYFGANIGSVDKCMIEPTQHLIEISQYHGIGMTYFVDSGFLVKLKEYASEYPELWKEYDKICDQLRLLIRYGNDVQLHIHPHWEKSTFDGKNWHLATKEHYRFSSFSATDQLLIFEKYLKELELITEQKITAFRAGGWCIEPTEDFLASFRQFEIKVDSSVFPKNKITTPPYNFDYSKTPNKSWWRFSTDVAVEDVKGDFLEYPTSVMYYSPLFFWRLYILGRLFPKQHKPIGDGDFLAMKGRKKESLTKGLIHIVSADGYLASELSNALKTHLFAQKGDLVVLSHPKSATNFSIRQLDLFIGKNTKRHKFLLFKDIQ